MSLKIIAVSDTHNYHKPEMLPSGDVLIHAGDFSGSGNTKELRVFIEWCKFQSPFFKKILLVPGNHDFTMLMKEKRDELLANVPNLLIMDDTSIEIDGIKFHGSPYVPTFGRWAFMKDDSRLKMHWDAIPLDTQILITHTPPHNILDQVDYPDLSGEDHAGSKTLAQRLPALTKLRLHVFGHIHESAGVAKIGEVTYINAAQVNRDYENVFKPHIYTFE